MLNRFDDYEISIDGAYDSIIKTPTEYDWRSAIEEAVRIIEVIPQAAVAKNSEVLVSMLEGLESVIERLKEMAMAVASDSGDQ